MSTVIENTGSKVISSISNTSVKIIDSLKKINYDLQANIVVVIIVGIVLLWVLGIFNVGFIVLLLLATNIYVLYWLYDKQYIIINIDNDEKNDKKTL